MAPTPLRDEDPSRIGQYRLVARLGSGGMGVVYLGTGSDGTRAAVKVLRPELADDEDFRARFRREVAALGRVDGICTVRVLQAETESDRPFLATEYADGPSMSEWVTRRGPFGPDMLESLALGLAEALAAIHAAGIVHRDLKPGNVLLTADGPKVIDFGIAQALDATAVTRTGVSVGSPGFMAPEQVRGQAGQPADIFAWALTVAYAASGQPPFGVGPADVIFFRILHDEPDLTAVPGKLRGLVRAALAKDPAERPTAPRLLAALTSGEAAIGGDDMRTVLSRSWEAPAGSRATGGSPETYVRRPARRWARQHPVVLAVGVAAALLAATLATVTFAESGPGGVVTQYTPVPSPVFGTAPYGDSANPSPGPLFEPSPYVPPQPESPIVSGSCQANCGPGPLVASSGITGPAPADAYVRRFGYPPSTISPPWDPSAVLNVVIAGGPPGPGPGYTAFFFAGGKFVGEDVNSPSSDVLAIRVNSTEITLRYSLYGYGGAYTGKTADVRFKFTGGVLVALDPMPYVGYRT